MKTLYLHTQLMTVLYRMRPPKTKGSVRKSTKHRVKKNKCIFLWKSKEAAEICGER